MKEDEQSGNFHRKFKAFSEWATSTELGKTFTGTSLALLTTFFAVPVNILSDQIVQEINVSSYAFLRFSCITLLLLPLMICKCKSLDLSSYSKQEWMAMFLSGMARAAALLTFNFSLYYIDVFDMTVFAALKPVMVALFLCCVPGEKADLFDVIPLVLSIIGSILIAQPPAIFNGLAVGTLKSAPFVAYLYAISSPMFYAINNIVCRKLRKIPLLLSVFMQSFGGIPLTLPLTFAFEGFQFPLTRKCIYEFVSVNFLYIGRLTSHTFALYFIPSVNVSVIDSSRIPLTFLVDYLLFDILPNWLKIVGTVIVVVAVFLYLFKPTIVQSCTRQYDKKNGDETIPLVVNNGGSRDALKSKS